MAAGPHIPVLYQDIIHALQPRSGGSYVDCTLGAGGHAQGILEASQPDGKLLGLDLDPQAITIAKDRLTRFGERVQDRTSLLRGTWPGCSSQSAGKVWTG